MSFGDPNNPYGQPQGQGQQPGYGYPQQAPQGVPPQQGGYGYPAAPAYGGYPGAAMAMPGGVKAARVILWILGVLQVLMGIIMALAGGWFADQLSSSSSEFENTDGAAAAVTGVFVVLGIVVLAFGVWAIMMAVKSATGGNGVRISAIVYGSLSTLGSLVNLLGGNVFALVSLALGILIIVFYAKSDAADWFKRNRQQY
ncbi:hypothetical protein [Streptomyces globisporus]|uniref:hypothetical protein n=1 Tax=Streptomyces globisporus TaxID=1908 RepID=UPI0004CA110B|nr:hypothetical protein [Streptomyces globisporus]